MQDARDSALSIVKGHRVAELMSIGEEIYDEYMAERIWPGTRALAQAHLDAGQQVWLVTAAPVETATVIARRLGLTGALGTVAESVDGVYTGRSSASRCTAPRRRRRYGRWPPRRTSTCRAAPRTATRTTTSRCSPWSATRYAINPDAKLRKHARDRDWRLRDYRTGRKAAKVGIPAAAGVGAVAGGTAAAVALHRRRR